MNTVKANGSISIVIFIDALGWEVLRGRRFLEDELPFRRRLRSVLGFSSACVPSILTGLVPRDHRHWSFFYHNPDYSPFRPLRPLRFLPDSVAGRGRVRSLLSRLVKRLYGYTGYFQLYNMPFSLIDRFDYCEKKDLFEPGGITGGPSIFDYLRQHDIPYHCSNWRESEVENLAAAKACLAEGEVAFAFVYLAAMDSLLHQVGKNSAAVDEKLSWYETQLRSLLATAREAYRDVRVFICSDHGMCTVERVIGIMAAVAALVLREGEDYVATYDSTMARSWFKNDAARAAITGMLAARPDEGRILSADELKALGCDFEGDQYGEAIFLVRPGTLIVPSHMGTQPITGMHGYHPDHPDSDAVLLSNVATPEQLEAITDLFALMCTEASAAASSRA